MEELEYQNFVKRFNRVAGEYEQQKYCAREEERKYLMLKQHRVKHFRTPVLTQLRMLPEDNLFSRLDLRLWEQSCKRLRKAPHLVSQHYFDFEKRTTPRTHGKDFIRRRKKLQLKLSSEIAEADKTSQELCGSSLSRQSARSSSNLRMKAMPAATLLRVQKSLSERRLKPRVTGNKADFDEVLPGRFRLKVKKVDCDKVLKSLDERPKRTVSCADY